MFGNFQQSHLRLEVHASESLIRESLTHSSKLGKWLFLQGIPPELPEKLQADVSFSNQFGFISVHHKVTYASNHCLRLLLSEGIDGYHEWYWGEGWFQSSLVGISLLPLNLGQTILIWRLRQFLTAQQPNA